jgi:hypothetical protein
LIFAHAEDVKLSQSISTRNGFGPIPCALVDPPLDFDIEASFDWNAPHFTHLRELELQYVLGQLSLVEEAAICLYTPLVGLVWYRHGNIGKKGSVTFV